MKAIISDSTTLIILGKINRLHIIKNLFNIVFIPQSVYNEIFIKDDLVVNNIKNTNFIEIKLVEEDDLLNSLNILFEAKKIGFRISKDLEADFIKQIER